MTTARWRLRGALGLPPSLVPVSAYLVLGIALGPRAGNVVTEDALAHLDALISIALATLGVVGGLALPPAAARARGVLLAASVESGISVLLVGAALAVLLHAWHAPVSSGIAAVALVLAAAAAPSAAAPADVMTDPDERAHEIADLDDVLPVALAAGALPALLHEGAPAIVAGVAAPIAIGVIVSVVGWLLFERAATPGERAVFVLGTLAILGGGCAYVALSPLLAGLACGVCWRVLPGRADALIAADLRKFHHPLVLLLLIEAGAQLAPSRLAVWLFAAFVVFRMAGKIAGGAVAAKLAPTSGAVLGAYLLAPGVVGIAIARNYQQVSAGDGTAVLTAVAAAAAAFEAVAVVVLPRGASR